MSSSSGERLVRVASASNPTEAEMIKGLLEVSGIPSVVKGDFGVEVPRYFVPGSCDVFVPESAAEAAREVLASAPDSDLPGV